MCNPLAIMAAGAGASAVSAKNNAKAQQQTLLYDAQVADNNAIIAENNQQIAEWQAQDALQQGYLDVQALQMKTAAVKSTQKAALAANGVDITEGSAREALSTTDWARAVDEQTIRDNALRSAWGYRTQGIDYVNQANSQRDSAGNLRRGARSISPSGAAAMSLLSSSGQVASTWYSMKQANSGVGATQPPENPSATGADIRARR